MASGRSNYSLLCRQVGECFCPYKERLGTPLTKESEKDLLIALSRVMRQIQLWTHEFDFDSCNVNTVKCSGASDDHDCLSTIVSDLLLMLAVESQYVQHLSGNILVVISEFVLASGSSWDKFIHLLCACFKLVIYDTLSGPLEPPRIKSVDSNCDLSSLIVALKLKMKGGNWSVMAGVIRVLRIILKHLKQGSEDQLFQVYLDSVYSCLVSVHWYLFNELNVGCNGELPSSFSGDVFFLTNVGKTESRIVFYGNLVQFFCSLVDQKGLETGSGPQDKHPIISEISNLVPKLLAWCLGKETFNNLCICQYFRHKMLMLMIRLSFQIHLEGSVLLSWLQLIHEYFQDLLLLPISHEPEQDDCLEGSPFSVSVSDVGIHCVTSRHLQRLAIFLFLRCSFSLINLGGKSGEQCNCTKTNPFLTFGLNSNLNCCSRQKGLSEVHKWLQVHLPVDMFLCHELYFERCTNFSLSFLRLYIHEDDILFEVLLNLLGVSVCDDQGFCRERGAFQMVKDNMLFHVSSLFNPIHLFHLFLAELHYDHQVLLDYLISKDTGPSSAEYLLRCLRLICSSWNVFVEFSLGGKAINGSSDKRRKILFDRSYFLGERSSASVKADDVPPLLGKECQEDHKNKEWCRTNSSFEKAKECLLSLKKSVKNLHQKTLFPYNPKVLLRRLMRFQELCLTQ